MVSILSCLNCLVSLNFASYHQLRLFNGISETVVTCSINIKTLICDLSFDSEDAFALTALDLHPCPCNVLMKNNQKSLCVGKVVFSVLILFIKLCISGDQ